MIKDTKNEIESFLAGLKYPTFNANEQEELERTAQWRAQDRAETAGMAASGVPLRHLKQTALENDSWHAKLESVKGRIGEGVIVCLIGPRGTGKTQMAVSLARIVCRAGRSARYATAMGIFLELQETFDGGKKSSRGVIDEYTKPSLLIIDEMHERGETGWEDRVLTHLIDRRYGNLRDTILISNQTKDQMLAAVGPSVASRLSETGGIVTCDWKSFRTKK